MSDYIRKSDVMGALLCCDSLGKKKLVEVSNKINERPTLSEAEIIRKAFERVVERLEKLNLDGFEMIEDGKYKLIRKKEAIEIVKEECGISE